ncbi:hypothetical protein M0812_00980 [Anaeramoeba flamelloides]|uniref:Transmembrane protein n=1 Tax=Anaeramoeba flamelloides TaxID=1746091 RepID=A0AAV8A6V3_9EUKA|nr:hypothetical protein M0812_00980 [Anaeramoeba flamelloides]
MSDHVIDPLMGMSTKPDRPEADLMLYTENIYGYKNIITEQCEGDLDLLQIKKEIKPKRNTFQIKMALKVIFLLIIYSLVAWQGVIYIILANKFYKSGGYFVLQPSNKVKNQRVYYISEDSLQNHNINYTKNAFYTFQKEKFSCVTLNGKYMVSEMFHNDTSALFINLIFLSVWILFNIINLVFFIINIKKQILKHQYENVWKDRIDNKKKKNQAFSKQERITLFLKQRFFAWKQKSIFLVSFFSPLLMIFLIFLYNGDCLESKLSKFISIEHSINIFAISSFLFSLFFIIQCESIIMQVLGSILVLWLQRKHFILLKCEGTL